MGSSSSKSSNTTTSTPTIHNDLPPLENFEQLDNSKFLYWHQNLSRTHCKQLYTEYEQAKQSNSNYLIDNEAVYKLCELYHMDKTVYDCLLNQEKVDVKEMENAVQNHMGEFNNYNTFGSMGLCVSGNKMTYRLLNVRKLEKDPSLDKQFEEIANNPTAHSCHSFETNRFLSEPQDTTNILHKGFAQQQLIKCNIATKCSHAIMECLENPLMTFNKCLTDDDQVLKCMKQTNLNLPTSD
jgi:hypothetical protein